MPANRLLIIKGNFLFMTKNRVRNNPHPEANAGVFIFISSVFTAVRGIALWWVWGWVAFLTLAPFFTQ
ncbi:hypothetical protein [Marinobacter sp. X15-166B]|uniref:hypothetical protein n=1 Tax=Marinobacter sp. X15-166B TaxID=1897620 RepID=UPI00085C6A4F|nr:hypothetical protein [Marinobacter sp. X15-166B]OEY66744.1 hypothetical protein BG841_09960 [Marinobacter sp. X15-166B]